MKYTIPILLLVASCGTGTLPCQPYGNDPECEFYNETDGVEQEPEVLAPEGPCAAIGDHLGKPLVPFGNVSYRAWRYDGAGQPVGMHFEGFPFAWAWTLGMAVVGNVAELYVVADPITNTTELVMDELSSAAPYAWIQTRGVTAGQLGETPVTLVGQSDGSAIAYVSTVDITDWSWWLEGPYGSQVRVRGHVTSGSAVLAGPATSNMQPTSSGGMGFRPAAGLCTEPPMPPNPCAVIAEYTGLSVAPREPYPETFIGNASGIFEDIYPMSWTPIVGWLWDGMVASPLDAAAQLMPLQAGAAELWAFYPGTVYPGDFLWVHTGALVPGEFTEGDAWLTDDVGFTLMTSYSLADGSELHFNVVAGGVGNPAIRTTRAIRGRVRDAGAVEAGPAPETTGATQAFGAAFVPSWGVCAVDDAPVPVDPCALIAEAVGENLEPLPGFVDSLDWGGPLRWAGDPVGVLAWENETWVWIDAGDPGDPAILDPGEGELALGFDGPQGGAPGWAYVITQGGDGDVEQQWSEAGAMQSVSAEPIEFDDGFARVWAAPSATVGYERVWIVTGELDVRGIVTAGGSMPAWVDGVVAITDPDLGGAERGFVASFGYCVPSDGTPETPDPPPEPLDETGMPIDDGSTME